MGNIGENKIPISALVRRRYQTYLAAALALIFLCWGQSAAIASKLDSLRDWDGTYPSGGGAVNFFAVSEVRQPLEKLLGKKDFQLLTREYSLETPIKAVGDYLCAKKCRPHNCGAENAAFAMDLRNGSIFVMMFFMDDDGKVTVRWFESKEKHTTLPEAVQTFLTNFSAQ